MTESGLEGAPDFLRRLGLDLAAEPKSIRRAYAQALKHIDQAADAQRFQQLREDYETALQWAGHHGAGMAATSIATGPAPKTETSPDPQVLAAVAFARFQAAIDALAAGAQSAAASSWRDALQAALDTDELVNLSACTIFEERIAALLLHGWRRGHDSLFPAACQAFGWERDRRRLQLFGRMGVMLNQAIDELAIFETQPVGDLDAQRDVLRRLQQLALPDKHVLVHDMFYLEQLLARFPALATIIVDPHSVDRWRQAYRDLPQTLVQRHVQRQQSVRNAAQLPPPPPDVGARSNGASGQLVGWLGLLLLFIAVNLLIYFFGSPSSQPRDRPAADWPAPLTKGAPAAAPVVKPHVLPEPPKETSSRASPPPGPERWRQVPVDKNLFRDVGKRIVYLPAPGALPGVRKVEFRFKLDAKGQVASVTTLQRSMDPAYDEAAEQALRASPPLPQHANSTFTAWFSVELTLRPAERTAEETPAPAQTE